MPSQTNESAHEACIEHHLTGGVSVVPSSGTPVMEDVGTYKPSKGAGYLRGEAMGSNTPKNRSMDSRQRTSLTNSPETF